MEVITGGFDAGGWLPSGLADRPVELQEGEKILRPDGSGGFRVVGIVRDGRIVPPSTPEEESWQ